jgi:hypothetical protein
MASQAIFAGTIRPGYPARSRHVADGEHQQSWRRPRREGAALKRLIAGPTLLYVSLFGLLSASLQIFTRYARYVFVLKLSGLRGTCLCLWSAAENVKRT